MGHGRHTGGGMHSLASVGLPSGSRFFHQTQHAKAMATGIFIEALEARIAPAAVFINATTATYNDTDGDHVTVKFSKPLLTVANVDTVLVTAASGVGEQLQMIDLTGV